MKKILFPVILLSTTAIGAVAGNWWYRADKIQEVASQIIAISKQPGKGPAIEATISKSGFPLRPGITLNGLTITTDTTKDVSAVIKSGSPTISTPLFGHAVRYETNGDLEANITVKGGKTYAIKSTGGNTTAEISVTDFHKPETAEEALKKFRGITFNSDPYQVVDAKTNAVLMKSDAPSSFSFSADAGEDVKHFRLETKSEKVSATAELDTMFSEIMSAIVKAPVGITGFTYYGEMNMEMAAAFDGQIPGKGQPVTKPLLLNIEKFESTNALSNTSINGKIEYTPNAPDGHGAVQFHFKQNHTPKSDQFTAFQIQQLLKNPMVAAGAPGIAALDDTQKWNLAASIAPRFSSLGEIKQDIDLVIDKKGATQTADITQFDLGFTPYGITTKGKVNSAATSGNMAEATIRCRNCTNLWTDLGNYVYRVQHAIKPLIPAEALQDPKMAAMNMEWRDVVVKVQGAFQTLASVNGSDWDYTIVQPVGGEGKVNQHGFMDAMMILMGSVGDAAAAMPQGNAPAPVEAPPAPEAPAAEIAPTEPAPAAEAVPSANGNFKSAKQDGDVEFAMITKSCDIEKVNGILGDAGEAAKPRAGTPIDGWISMEIRLHNGMNQNDFQQKLMGEGCFQ